MTTDSSEPFSAEQKHYLEGFIAGSGIARSMASLPTFATTIAAGAQTQVRPGSEIGRGGAPARPEDIHLAAQDRFLAQGKTLCPEEMAKRNKHGLDIWEDLLEHARQGKFPKGTDVFLFKFQGLFYVAPAQNAFMCRLRFPAGIIKAHQMRGLADLAEQFAGGYADMTTRGNLQLREIGPANTVQLLLGLHDLGIINRGAGADNIRNITASPTSGIDPRELLDVRPLARELHHYILNHRELYGLPRKFNIALDSGANTAVLEDTNDIGFCAVEVGRGRSVEAGIYLRVQLGGITGHRQFAKDVGIVIQPRECIPTAAAVIKAFIEHGDRTDRKKARLKYVLDRMGYDDFVAEVEKHLGRKFQRLELAQCQPRTTPARGSHLGIHPQKQEGLFYVGVTAAVGRLSVAQMRVLADIARDHGDSDLRLTVWQSAIISGVRRQDIKTVQSRLDAAGLRSSSRGIRAGLVACTGNCGCKYSASDTKRHALQIAEQVDSSVQLDQLVNVHLTGCPHSCAQHYIGDIGLLGTKVGPDSIEGYHLYLGGGYGASQEIGRELQCDIPAEQVPATIQRMLSSYMSHRREPSETFCDFVRRHSTQQLQEIFELAPVPAEVG